MSDINQKKSLLFVVPSWHLGGTERVNIAIADKLLEKHDVFIYTLSNPNNEALPSDTKVLGEKKYSFELFTSLSGLFGLLHFNVLNRVLMDSKAKKITKICNDKNIDTIVVSSGSIYLIPFLKKQNPERKVVAWCHFSADLYLNGYLRYTTDLWIDGLSAADEVVCLTREDRDKFVKINNNTVVINNPVTINNNQISNLENKIISWTGRISNPQKGIDYLAEIAGKLPEGWTISVAGTGDMELMKELLIQNNAENRVVLHGSLSGEELQKHYLNSSIYLMTSRYEGFPLVLAEAMSFGLPIVAFEQSGSKEALDFGKVGVLVESGNVDLLVMELNKLINSIEERRKYQILSLSKFKELKIEKIIKKWENLLVL